MKDSLYTTTYRLAVTGKTSLLLCITYKWYAAVMETPTFPYEPAFIEIQSITHCNYEIDSDLYEKYQKEFTTACEKHCEAELDAIICLKAEYLGESHGN